MTRPVATPRVVAASALHWAQGDTIIEDRIRAGDFVIWEARYPDGRNSEPGRAWQTREACERVIARAVERDDPPRSDAPSFTQEALEVIEESGADWEHDVDRLRSGDATVEELVEFCFDGAAKDRHQGWRDYLSAVVATALPDDETDLEELCDIASDAAVDQGF